MRLLAILLGISTLAPAGAQDGPKLRVRTTIDPGFEVAAEKIIDLDGDGHEELLVVGVNGEVRTWQPPKGDAVGVFTGTFNLPEPSRSLIAIARLNGGGARHLVVFSPRGVHGYGLKDGCYVEPGHRLVARGRFTLRVAQPRLANIAQDVNGDGRSDLVLPGRTDCTLYLNRKPTDPTAWPTFVRASRLGARVRATADTDANALSDTLESSVHIPDLRTRDVNGDGREDLIAKEGKRRHYFLQGDDGRFPTVPDVTLDLGIFRDTTPAAGVELGRTLASDAAIFHSRDLDGDGIPDHLIAHRRKIWVFHGTKQGPQFKKPATILKLADDVTFLMPMHLDDDAYPDLLVFKLKVPTLATIFKGLFFDWDIHVKTVGYANEGGRTFARKPRQKSETTLRVPSILGLIRSPEGIVKRFKNIGRKFRHVVEGDLDGDEKIDILLQTEDRKGLQFWLMKTDSVRDKGAAEKRIRALLFEHEDRIWDVDRVLGFMQAEAEGRTTRLTQGTPAAGSFALRDPDEYRLDFAAIADLDGDGRGEVVLHYLSLSAPPRSTFDILSLQQ